MICRNIANFRGVKTLASVKSIARRPFAAATELTFNSVASAIFFSEIRFITQNYKQLSTTYQHVRPLR